VAAQACCEARRGPRSACLPRRRRPPAGFTLVEVALIVLIVGFLIALVVQGQQLIRNSRVRTLLAQQDAVITAVLGFQDRYRALPGDYRDAAGAIACVPACLGGNGNGRIDSTGSPPESILVWAHLSGAGFLTAAFTATSGTASPAPDNTPRNIYGGYMQVVFDDRWSHSGNTVRRHNIKTGSGIPVDVIAELDRKLDDGLPTSGRFQFAPYTGGGPLLLWGGTDDSCTSQDIADPSTVWNATSGWGDCGGTTLF
jgi:type II secretory pathway pseudopilin PulG